MTTLIVSDSNFNDPNNLIPYLEKDEAITRGVTRGLVDFSNPACYSGTGPIASGAALTSLTIDASAGSFGAAFDAVANGMLPFSKGIPAAKINLPAPMKFTAAATKVLFVLWAKIPGTGWPIVAANPIWALFGVMANSSSKAQFGISVGTNMSDGSVATVVFYVPSSGAASAGNVSLAAGSTLSSITDGGLHQLAVVWDARSIPGMQSTTLYVDKVKAAQVAPRTYDGSFNIPPSDGPTLGYSTAFNGGDPMHAGVRLGRPGVWDLSSSQLDPVDIIAADFAAAQGYLS
jgi:hypothetical protein